MDQVEGDVDKLTWDVLLSSKHKHRQGKNIYSSVAAHVELN